jgi:hypothetical protein
MALRFNRRRQKDDGAALRCRLKTLKKQRRTAESKAPSVTVQSVESTSVSESAEND